jgi:hypothetical protein
MSYTNGVIVLLLGKPESKSVSLTLPFSDQPYSGNALADAEKYGVKQSFDALASAKAFLEGPSSQERRQQ